MPEVVLDTVSPCLRVCCYYIQYKPPPCSSVGEEVSLMSLRLELGDKRATIGTKSCCHTGVGIMEPGLLLRGVLLPLESNVTPNLQEAL